MNIIQIVLPFITLFVSSVVGIGIWKLQNRIKIAEVKRQEREDARQKSEILLIEGCGAAISLGESTAIALKNGKCNGETEKALKYAQEVKVKQKNFLYEQGIRAVWGAEA